jgi:hypothetical protein
MENEQKPERGHAEPLREVFDRVGDLPRGKETYIKLGADPDELEAAIRTCAYHQGYREGLWDCANLFLAGLMVGAVAYWLLGR